MGYEADQQQPPPGEVARCDDAAKVIDGRTTERKVLVTMEYAWARARVKVVEFPEVITPIMRHDRHMFVMNTGGPAQEEFRLEGQPWRHRTHRHHQVGFVPAGVGCALRNPVGGERTFIEVAPAFVEELQPEPRALRYLPFLAAPARYLALALIEEARTPSACSALAVESALGALVHHVLGHDGELPQARGVSLPSPKLRQVIDFATAHLDQRLGLQELAALLDMDLYRFVRAFKQSTGTSPYRFLLQLRVVRAKELLRDASLSIARVASLTGFASQSHFAATFRRLTGTTPRGYRAAFGASADEPP